MEAELRADLTADAYVHEVLAEFGTQEKGVFDKDKLDQATKIMDYAYNELTFFQKKKLKEEGGIVPEMHMYSRSNKPKRNAFRSLGIDWDKK